jgi:uncharacterized protein YbjT (DUF2867 family)
MLLVIGATGKIGREVVRQLDERGLAVRALVRDVSRAPSGAHVSVVVGDLAQPASLAQAFAGVDAAFVVLGGAGDKLAELEKNAFTAAKSAGTKHVVLISSAGASIDSDMSISRMHGEAEAALAASGLAYTFLRPTSFMQNQLGSARTVKAEGKIFGAMGTGKVPHVDVADIAACAAAVLANPAPHAGKSYVLTGPQALSMDEVAAAIGDACGKSVSYVDIGVPALVANMKKMGAPAWLAEDFGKLNARFASGASSTVSDDVARITGRPARSFAEFARENASAFRS